MHSQLTALFIIGNSLDHGAENIRVNLSPVQTTDVQQVGACNFAKLWYLHTAREQPTVDIGEAIGPTRNPCSRTLSLLGIHGTENFADHLMGVSRVSVTHLGHGVRKQAAAIKDVGVFRKEAENQPCHKVVHLMALLFCTPAGVVLQQLYI